MPKPKPKAPDLTFTLETDKAVYEEGEEVKIAYKVRNKGNGEAVIKFSSSQLYDIIVSNKDGDDVWHWSAGQSFSQAETTLTINPGQTETYEVQWDQNDNNGDTVPLGTYRIQAFLTTTNQKYKSVVSTRMGIRTLPTFESCEELWEKLKELRKPKKVFYPPPRIPLPWPRWPIPMIGSFGSSFGVAYGGGISTPSMGFSAVPYASSAPSGGTGTTVTEYEYSTTNTQVTGVDESDVIKNDGEHIYMIKGKSVRIVKAYPVSELDELPMIDYEGTSFTPTQLYVDVDNEILVVIGNEPGEEGECIYYPWYSTHIWPRPCYAPRSTFTRVYIYDISDTLNISEQRTIKIEAQYLQSRKVGNYLYIIMNEDPPYDILDDEVTDSRVILPIYHDSSIHADDEGDAVCDCTDIAYFPGYTEPNYLVITAIPVNMPDQDIGTALILGKSQQVYASTQNLYVTTTSYVDESWPSASPINPDVLIPLDLRSTEGIMIYKFSFNEDEINYSGKGKVPGTIINQFSMDEHEYIYDAEANEYFRIATTISSPRSSNVYILGPNMKLVGVLEEDIAMGENIRSVRFIGDKGYIVTFRVIDPFFVITLADPTAPEVLGELKIPGYTTYLHPYDENHILGFGRDVVNNFEMEVKISLFDVTDVSNPVEEDKLEIGWRRSDSELLSNHKAFMFIKSRNIMAFPITVTEPKHDSSYQYQYIFQGAYICSFDDSDPDNINILSEADITHYDEGKFPSSNLSPLEDSIKRITYIDDYYYTISSSKVEVVYMNDYSEQGVVEIAE